MRSLDDSMDNTKLIQVKTHREDGNFSVDLSFIK